jgi:ketosteroid isomerase-like protein
MMDEKMVTDFFAHLSGRRSDLMSDYLHQDAQLLFPKTHPLHGRERILKFFGVLFRQFPELTFTIHRIIIQGDRVAAHWTNKGVNRRGEPYENEGVTLMEAEDGKIRLLSDFFKDTEKF